jgi:heterotetrameric sarcosine oxidase gamma subunit
VLDAGPRWTPPPDWTAVRISRPGLDVRSLAGLRQVTISGNLVAGLRELCPAARLKGPHDPDDADPCAIRVAADRVLLVATRLDNVAAGHSAWHEAGFAATDLGDAMIVCSLDGADAPALLARGTGVELTAPSSGTGGGAAMLLAGTRVIAYRHGPTGLRLHVDRAMAPYLWRWLESAAEALG